MLNLERTALLAALRSEHAGRPVPSRRLLEDFIGPVMSRAGHGDAGWRSYTQLIATLANAAEWSALVDRPSRCDDGRLGRRALGVGVAVALSSGGWA